MANDDNVTGAVLLQHMQAMEQRLTVKIDDARMELKDDVKRVEGKVDLALTQISNIDTRLDDLEVVQLPSIKKAVGMK